jgi:hypothetical protein
MLVRLIVLIEVIPSQGLLQIQDSSNWTERVKANYKTPKERG